MNTVRVAGIDVGAAYTKAVITAPDHRALGRALLRTGHDFAGAAAKALDQALADAGLERQDLAYIASTGFGRHRVPFSDLAVTELTCHAKAAHMLDPSIRTVLDLGGQSTKAIRIGARGQVVHFRMNDKCAAGGGAFLEKTARFLGYRPEEVEALLVAAVRPVPISSVCAVFAESEVINHISAGARPEDVLAGVVDALAQRAAQLLRRLGTAPGSGKPSEMPPEGPEPACALAGGLARLPHMKRALERELDIVFTMADADMAIFQGTLGAAALGHARLQRLTRPTGLHDREPIR